VDFSRFFFPLFLLFDVCPRTRATLFFFPFHPPLAGTYTPPAGLFFLCKQFFSVFFLFFPLCPISFSKRCLCVFLLFVDVAVISHISHFLRPCFFVRCGWSFTSFPLPSSAQQQRFYVSPFVFRPAITPGFEFQSFFLFLTFFRLRFVLCLSSVRQRDSPNGPCLSDPPFPPFSFDDEHNKGPPLVPPHLVQCKIFSFCATSWLFLVQHSKYTMVMAGFGPQNPVLFLDASDQHPTAVSNEGVSLVHSARVPSFSFVGSGVVSPFFFCARFWKATPPCHHLCSRSPWPPCSLVYSSFPFAFGFVLCTFTNRLSLLPPRSFLVPLV